jgi:hypothetical protein
MLRKAGKQAGNHGMERLAEVVVADPVLEEVAQDVERLGGARFALQERDEALVRLRSLRGEVQVGDESASLPEQASQASRRVGRGQMLR